MPRYLPATLAKAARQGGQVVTHIDVMTIDKSQLLLTTRDTLDAPKLTVTGGSVDTDESRSVPGRVTFEATLSRSAAALVVPSSTSDPLSPLKGQLVQVSFGTPDWFEETAYGAYEVASVEVNDDGGAVTMQVEAYDLARRVQRAKFPSTISRSGWVWSDILYYLISGVLPDATAIEIAISRSKSGLVTWDAGSDRLEAALTCAANAGQRIDWNDGGIANVRSQPDTPLDADPAWTFSPGGNCRVTKLTRGMDDDEAHNGVIVTGDSAGSDKPPPWAVAWDSDPTSPTYFDPLSPDTSAYGPHPAFISDSTLRSKRDCQARADRELPKLLGLPERLRLTGVPCHAITPSDPILVEAGNVNQQGIYIVEAVSLPFTAGDMDLTCRQRRLPT